MAKPKGNKSKSKQSGQTDPLAAERMTVAEAQVFVQQWAAEQKAEVAKRKGRPFGQAELDAHRAEALAATIVREGLDARRAVLEPEMFAAHERDAKALLRLVALGRERLGGPRPGGKVKGPPALICQKIAEQREKYPHLAEKDVFHYAARELGFKLTRLGYAGPGFKKALKKIPRDQWWPEKPAK